MLKTEIDVFEHLKSRDLQTLPQVLSEVIRVVDQGKSAPDDLTVVISKDLALAIRLLKVANSALYPHKPEFKTIKSAVVYFGIPAAKAILLSTGLYWKYKDSAGPVDPICFWRHSLETAIACREIAMKANFEPHEEAFLLGLIHDIGIIILAAGFSKESKQIWERVHAGESLVDVEESILGINHARLGKLLLDHWHFSSDMGEAIAQHHDDFSAPQKLLPSRLARIVSLGNAISTFRITKQWHVDEKYQERIHNLAKSLRISPQALTSIQTKLPTMLVEESQLLEMNIGSITELLETANKLLYQQYLLLGELLNEERKKQEEIANQKVKEISIKSLKAIAATLSHHINNISTTILGEGERLQGAISKGKVTDIQDIALDYSKLVMDKVEEISGLLLKLRELSSFEVMPYTDESWMLKVADKLQETSMSGKGNTG